mmetsp:Transcript_27328/g.62718  ORF Transcript_27328/g.62718 Transcript_27328/m.62718 type:complete len:81 (+) Transcript_27328:2973-3215(+)
MANNQVLTPKHESFSETSMRVSDVEIFYQIVQHLALLQQGEVLIPTFAKLIVLIEHMKDAKVWTNNIFSTKEGNILFKWF